VTTPSGTLIGFDFGERRIGVAVGETQTHFASPIGSIHAVANEVRFREIDKLVREWKPAAFVVGRPKHSDGSEHVVAKLAEKFARRLRAKYQVPVLMVDETLSSASAEEILRELRATARPTGDVDAVAAAIILQAYLDDPAASDHAAS
jgi:putative Holliday junction resolvase